MLTLKCVTVRLSSWWFGFVVAGLLMLLLVETVFVNVCKGLYHLFVDRGARR